uniref:Uncharacterized protein n=1 Tax=Anguilla anguilla TaxID=7936 RepID=A0A0E9R7L7_ANGAN
MLPCTNWVHECLRSVHDRCLHRMSYRLALIPNGIFLKSVFSCLYSRF